jgi:hypothetical protein
VEWTTCWRFHAVRLSGVDDTAFSIEINRDATMSTVLTENSTFHLARVDLPNGEVSGEAAAAVERLVATRRGGHGPPDILRGR